METIELSKLREIVKHNQQQDFFTKALKLYVPTQLGNYIGDQAPKDAQEVVTNWLLNKDKSCLLLLGDSGAGKTLFGQWLTQFMFEHPEQCEGRIPLFIPLLVHNPGDGLLDRYLKKTCELNKTERKWLKQQSLLVILDGFDELHKKINVYRSNEWWHLKDVKIIISCRSQWLSQIEDYQKLFCPYDKKEQAVVNKIQEQVVSPFTQDQRNDYIKQYVKLNQNKIKKRYLNTKEDWTSWETYKDHIDKLPGLRDVLYSPFVLSLMMQVLPKAIMEHQDKEHVEQLRLARINLYDHFVEQWFARQKVKLLKGNHIDEQCPIEEAYVLYSKRLAGAMLYEGVTSVEYVPVKQVVLNFLPISEINHSLQNNFIESNQPKENSWETFFNEEVVSVGNNQLKLSLIRAGCPLIKLSQYSYAFLHKSLLEYFSARELFEGLVAETSIALGFELNEKLLIDEPETLKFIAEKVKQEKSLEQRLFAVIEESKFESRVEIASANAITILNYAGVSFSGKNLKKIRVRKANLSYAILDSVDLRESDLREVTLNSAWLNKAKLGGSLMQSTHFTEQPYLKTASKVCCVTYHRDDLMMAAGLVDGTVALYCQQSNQYELVKVLKGHTSVVNSVAFSPNGKLLASGGFDNSIRLWDVEKQNLLGVLNGHKYCVLSVVFSPNSDQLASGGQDNNICLWDVRKQNILRVLKEHTSLVNSVTFSPNGKLLASGSHDYSIRLWDVRKQAAPVVLKGHTEVVWSVAFSPNGNLLASGSADNSIRLWDVEKQIALGVLNGHTGWIHCVAFSPSGEQLASSSSDKSIRLWNVAKQITREVLNGHTENVTSVTFNSSGERLASGSWDKSIRLWDVNKRTTLRVWNEHTDSMKSIAFSPNGDRLASSGKDNSICLWDVENQVTLGVLNGHRGWVDCMAFSPSGQLLASGSLDDSIRLWDVNKQIALKVLNGHTNTVTSVVFSSNEDQLASGSVDNSIRLWSIKKQIAVRVLNGHTHSVYCVAFSPNGDLLASGSKDNSIRLWNVKRQIVFGILNGHTSVVESVVFSPNGKLLASGSYDDSIRLWDVEKQTALGVLSGHTSFVTSIVFSSNGEQLASGSNDQSIRLWDVKSQKNVGCFFFTHRVKSLSFSQSVRNSKTLLCAGIGNDVYYFEVQQVKQKTKLLLLWSSGTRGLKCESLDLGGVIDLDEQSMKLLTQRGGVGKGSQKTTEKVLEERKHRLRYDSNNPPYDLCEKSYFITPKTPRVSIMRRGETCILFFESKLPDFPLPKKYDGNWIALEKQKKVFYVKDNKIKQEIVINKGLVEFLNQLEFDDENKIQLSEKPYSQFEKLIKSNGGELSNNSNHVFLLIEKIEDNCYTIVRADLFLDKRKEVQKGKFITSGEALVELCEKPWFEIEALLEQGCVYRSWELSVEQVEELINNLEQDRLQRLNYINVGKQSFFAKKQPNQHNCLTWCEEHLEKIGLNLKEQKSRLDVIVAYPKSHLPNNTNEKYNSDKEPTSGEKCVLF